MAFEQLKKLIASGEGAALELKETTGQRVSTCETLCAFQNKDGGAVEGTEGTQATEGTKRDRRDRSDKRQRDGRAS